MDEGIDLCGGWIVREVSCVELESVCGQARVWGGTLLLDSSSGVWARHCPVGAFGMRDRRSPVTLCICQETSQVSLGHAE